MLYSHFMKHCVIINSNSQPGQLKDTVYTQTTVHQTSSLLKWVTAALALPWAVLLAVTFSQMPEGWSHLLVAYFFPRPGLENGKRPSLSTSGYLCSHYSQQSSIASATATEAWGKMQHKQIQKLGSKAKAVLPNIRK